MKKNYYLLLAGLVALVMSSCSTYSYTSRTVHVDRQPVGQMDNYVNLDIDYNRQLTATSNFQSTRNAAIEEAYRMAIMDNHIDVLVDPIYEVRFDWWRVKNRFKAVVNGFAATYREAETPIDQMKEKNYSMEDIEKFKMLTTDDFYKYYYRQGDVYNYNIKTTETAAPKRSLLISPISEKSKRPVTVKNYDYEKSLQLRNAGIYTAAAGAAALFGIGIPCYLAGMADHSKYERTYSNMSSYSRSSLLTKSDAEIVSGAVFMAFGCAGVAAGIPMLAVGQVRMNKSNSNAEISVGVTPSQAGLRVKF